MNSKLMLQKQVMLKMMNRASVISPWTVAGWVGDMKQDKHRTDHGIHKTDQGMKTPGYAYEVQSNTQIFSIVDEKLNRLQQATTTTFLVGEPGIGKSKSLRRAVLATALLHSNVIPIYVEYPSTLTSPVALIVDALFKQGRLDETKRAKLERRDDIEEVSEVLESKGLRCLLVCDGVDRLYSSEAYMEERLTVLKQLSVLGNRCSAIATVVCGHGSVLEHLARGRGAEHARLGMEYPLAKLAPFIHGQNTRTKVVKSAPLDRDVFMQVVASHLGRPASEAHCNVISFFAGNNLARVLQACSMDQRNVDAMRNYFMRSPTDFVTERIVAAVNTEFMKRNRTLLTKVGMEREYWNEKLQGMTRDECSDMFRRAGRDEIDMRMVLDAGYFSMASEQDLVLPTSAFSIYSDYCMSVLDECMYLQNPGFW